MNYDGQAQAKTPVHKLPVQTSQQLLLNMGHRGEIGRVMYAVEFKTG